MKFTSEEAQKCNDWSEKEKKKLLLPDHGTEGII